MNKIYIVLVFATALLALPTIALSQGSTGDPCALVTPAEVSQALGVTVLPGHAMGTGDLKVCIFAPTAKFGPGERQVVVSLVPPAMFDVSNRSVGVVTVTPATVAGTDAYYMHTGKVTTLRLRKGDRAFQVRMNPGTNGNETPAQIEGIEKGLAEKAVARF